MNNDIDPLELQRLIDGQLDAEEQSCLFAWADDHPQNWRSIAAAFIQQQQLRRVMQDEAVRSAIALKTASGKRSVFRNILAVAASAVLAIATYSAGYHARSAQTNRSTSETESSTARSVAVQDPQHEDASESKTRITWSHLADSISEPLVDEPIREILARQGVMTFEQPVIYFIRDESGGGYVIPKREAVLVSQKH